MAAISNAFTHLQGPCDYQPVANSQSKTWYRNKSVLNQATKTVQNSTELRKEENICLK